MENYSNTNTGRQDSIPASSGDVTNDHAVTTNNNRDEASGNEVNFNAPNIGFSDDNNQSAGSQSTSAFSPDGQESSDEDEDLSDESLGNDLAADDDPSDAPESGTK
ncbi:MAG: hypothetical protein EOO48_02715 [Flavobacterium sp.]|nr:MAG: hypothetical protein EOO48_02715 [Flavobacterium sp.]